MTILGSMLKQPREVLDFDFDYTTTLAARSDTLATESVEVAPAGLTITSSTIIGSKIKVIVSSGTDAVTYKVTVLATTTAGLVFEDEINVVVGEL